MLASGSKVTIIHWAVSPTIGGVESYLVDLANGLSRFGYEVTLVSGERNPQRDLFQGISLRYAWDLDLNLESRDPGSGGLSLAQQLVQLTPDVVHAHNLDHFTLGPLRSIINANLDSVLLHTSHSLIPKPGAEPLLRGWKLLAASKFMAEKLARYYKQPVSTHPLPVNASRFIKASTVTQGRVSLLHPARVVPDKGQILTLRLARHLIDLGFVVDVVLSQSLKTLDLEGPVREYRARLLREVDRLQLRDRVIMASFDYHSIVDGYFESDVVVYPSTFEEPYGLAALEGMAARRPVVASRIGGLPEVIEDGVTGVLVPPRDERALVKAVESIVCDANLREGIVDAADLHVRTFCTVEQHVKALACLYGGGG